MPIDMSAEVLIKSSFAGKLETGRDRVSVFHPQNSNIISWSALLPTIVETLSIIKKTPVEVVPLKDWLKRTYTDVESSGSNIGEVVKILTKGLLRSREKPWGSQRVERRRRMLS